MLKTVWIASILAVLPAVVAISEWESLKVIKGFADQILQADQAGYSSDWFAEDAQGYLDIYGAMEGRETASQYVFGTFSQPFRHPEVPNIIGRPVGYNVTSLTVQHTTIATNIVFDLHYPMIERTVPLEVGAWFLLNEAGEIAQFDMSFKRFRLAMEDIVPLLASHISNRPNSTTKEAEGAIQQYLAASICKASSAQCGTRAGFANEQECLAYMLGIRLGEYDRMGGNNLLCRSLHLPLLSSKPEEHCDKISAKSKACVDRDYRDDRQPKWRHTWLAPKFITPENQHEVQDIFATHSEGLHPLIELRLSQSLEHSWSPTFFATFTFGLFLLIWASAKFTFLLMMWWSPTFRDISIEHQRNVTMYAITILWTSIALALQFPVIPLLLQQYGVYQLYCVRLAAVLVCALYIFELTFRFDMRLPLVAHHILTIVASALCVTMVEYTQSTSFIVSGYIWLFQATTEQPTFLGLLGYRMRWDRRFCSRLLKVAAIQTLVFKCASAAALLVWWGLHQRDYHRPMNMVWTVFVWVICTGLLCTQFWGSWITWKIGVRVGRPSPNEESSEGDVEAIVTTPVTVSSEKKGSNWNSANTSLATLPTLLNTPSASDVDFSKKISCATLQDPPKTSSDPCRGTQSAA